MPRFFKFHSKAKGKVPGSLEFHGERQVENVRFRVMSYDSNNLDEAECDSLEEAMNFIKDGKLTWINIDGLHDPEIIRKVGEKFDIHGLLLEDIMNPGHRPKFHSNENLLIIITKMLTYTGDPRRITSDQMSILAGNNFVISFQEKIGQQLNPVRERIRSTPNKVRLITPDYLTYALMDCLVDNYLEIAAEIGSKIEELELEIIEKPQKRTAEKIYQHRTEMNFLRKTVSPIREITLDFLRSEVTFINSSTREFLKDLNEHVLVLKETIDSYQVMVMDQMNMYNANVSNKANEIMKTLTVFASLFIPLTFLAGIYGMNFEVIPELSWPLGYAFFWAIALLLVGGLLMYFRKRKWF